MRFNHWLMLMDGYLSYVTPVWPEWIHVDITISDLFIIAPQIIIRLQLIRLIGLLLDEGWIFVRFEQEELHSCVWVWFQVIRFLLTIMLL